MFLNNWPIASVAVTLEIFDDGKDLMANFKLFIVQSGQTNFFIFRALIF